MVSQDGQGGVALYNDNFHGKPHLFRIGCLEQHKAEAHAWAKRANKAHIITIMEGEKLQPGVEPKQVQLMWLSAFLMIAIERQEPDHAHAIAYAITDLMGSSFCLVEAHDVDHPCTVRKIAVQTWAEFDVILAEDYGEHAI